MLGLPGNEKLKVARDEIERNEKGAVVASDYWIKWF